VKLVGTKSNRDGLGAQVEITLPNGKRLFNHATTSVGYASSSEPLVRFGLGAQAAVKLIRIRWPSGQVDELKDVKSGRVLTVNEGSAQAALR
jgi:enediyne biosynthesis protein E4